MVNGLLHKALNDRNIKMKISPFVEMTKLKFLMNRIELYTFLKTIPKGKVVTYGALAQYFSTSPRAIASMLHANRELEVFPATKWFTRMDELVGIEGE